MPPRRKHYVAIRTLSSAAAGATAAIWGPAVKFLPSSFAYKRTLSHALRRPRAARQKPGVPTLGRRLRPVGPVGWLALEATITCREERLCFRLIGLFSLVLDPDIVLRMDLEDMYLGDVSRVASSPGAPLLRRRVDVR